MKMNLENTSYTLIIVGSALGSIDSFRKKEYWLAVMYLLPVVIYIYSNFIKKNQKA